MSTKLKTLLLLLICATVISAAGSKTIQIINKSDNSATIWMDGSYICTAKAHSTNSVSGTYCSFEAKNGSHQVRVVFSDGHVDDDTLNISEEDEDTVKVVTIWE